MFSLLTTSQQNEASTENIASSVGFSSNAPADVPSSQMQRVTSFCENLIERLSGRTDIPDFYVTNYTCATVCESLLRHLETAANDKIPSSVDSLPFCVLGVTARFSKSDSLLPRERRFLNVRERHIVNTWLDRKGHVRCTCIGSTQYEILALNDEFQSPCCVHADAFLDIMKEVSKAVFDNFVISFEAFYEAFAVLKPEFVDANRTTLPLFRSTHNSRSVVYICEDVSGNGLLCWVPVRKVQRGEGSFLCAFCDMINTNRCHHVKKLRELFMEHMAQPEDHPSDADCGDEGAIESRNRVDSNATGHTSRSKNHQPVSTLPVGPVNCPMALKVDQEICELVRRNVVFKLKAPPLCTYCQSPRIEATRSENTSGVVMCSIGACRMEVDTYMCSVCRKQFSAEGRQQGVFVDSVCLAATHKLLRCQLIGFAHGNDTLSIRLDRFHSEVTAFEDARIFQNQLPSRSSRKLYDLCISFVRLMVCDPIASLFYCTTCQGGACPKDYAKQGSQVPRAICVDGIWAGYLKKSAIPFENVSEACDVPSFSRSVNSHFHKPRTSFLRLDKTATVLMDAIKGKTMEVKCGSINALVSAVRLVDDMVLPSDFYSTSICGTFPQDFREDIGEGCLSRLRNLTCNLFHEHNLLYRLLEPLQKLFQSQGKRRKTGASSANRTEYNNAHDVVTTSIAGIMAFSQEDEGACWNENVAAAMQKGDVGMKVFQLFQALLQGPVTHLVRREEIDSAKIVAEACTLYKPEDFMKAMVKKTPFYSPIRNETGSHGENNQHGANIIKTLRTMEGGIFSAAAVDTGAVDDSTQGTQILPAFGHLIAEAVKIVDHFHSFYTEHVTNGGSKAAEYVKKWSSLQFSDLRDLFVQLSSTVRFQPNWGGRLRRSVRHGCLFSFATAGSAPSFQ